MDDEEKFNKLVNIEMENQRRQIKLEREKLERQKLIQAEQQIKQQKTSKK